MQFEQLWVICLFVGLSLVSYYIAVKYVYQSLESNKLSIAAFVIVLSSSVGLLLLMIVEITKFSSE
mgnify:CR=1 FL=1